MNKLILEEPPAKVPLILFSGGLDSSYLLQYEMEKGPVDVLYVSAHQHGNKVKEEFHVRKKIIHDLTRLTGNYVRNEYHVEMVSYVKRGEESSWAFQQVHHWLLGALQVIDDKIHSSLLIAYVAGDQIVYHQEEIRKAWDALCQFSKTGDLVPLGFPLIYHTKREIFDKIAGSVYFRHWHCETPPYRGDDPNGPSPRSMVHTREPCGKCVPCITHAMNVYGWELSNNGAKLKDRMKEKLRFEIQCRYIRRLEYQKILEENNESPVIPKLKEEA